MLPHRTAGAPVPSPDHGPPWGARVRGLGICDVLQLRLAPGQLPALLGEIEARRAAHEEALHAAGAADDEEVERHRRSLALLRAIRDQLGPGGSGLVTGPASLISALVEGAARDAAEAPLELANARGTLSRDAAARLLEAANVARAWAELLADVRELEWFTFEPR